MMHLPKTTITRSVRLTAPPTQRSVRAYCQGKGEQPLDAVETAGKKALGAAENLAKDVMGATTGETQYKHVPLQDPYKDRPSTKYASQYRTTSLGAPVSDDRNSTTVGERGPVLLEDWQLQEKTAHLDRERIPERVVHARGAAAKGYFEVTKDISKYTRTDFLTGVGSKTPIITRFSTVTHPRNSPESLRDPRGFAIKFYSGEGNWDFVGLNFPAFWIRDSMAFADLVHALAPNPMNGIQEWWRIWDFLSFHPESCNILTYLLDDVGVPKDYRHMPGFGIHAFKLRNMDGDEFYAKFHFLPSEGEANLVTDDETMRVGGTNHSHATQDLWDSIAAGNYPEWTLFMQILEPKDLDKFEFEALDSTKLWPEELVPLQEVGKMVLNKNVDNFFNENEMLAFSFGEPVPGIEMSEDKLMQGRVLSYSDTQRHRLGPNYTQIPVNAPKCPFHMGNAQDGFMQMAERKEPVNYFPSRFDPTTEAPEYKLSNTHIEGVRTRKTIENEDNFTQAGDHWRSFPEDRQMRFVSRVAEKLTQPGVTEELQTIWVGYWKQCDERLGSLVEEKVRAMVPA